MKVHKCSTEAATLSYTDIQNEEGIYSIETSPASYLIVIKGNFGLGVREAILFFGNDRLEAPYSSSWSTSRFIKTNKKLYLEVR